MFVLEDDDDLRSVMVDLIQRATDRRCIGLGTLAELRARRQEVLRCTVGIIDVNLGNGQPSGLDAFAWLRAERFTGRVAFLTGHAAEHPLVARAQQMGEADVLRKPIDMVQLKSLLG